MLHASLLSQLLDGHFHSGTELASVLGVSRMTVSKQVGILRSLGLDVHAIRGKGYRLPGPPVMLDRALMLEGQSADFQKRLRMLEVLFEVDSTNSHLSRQLRHAPLEPGAVALCLAEMQSAGRGRRGREWVSPLGASLYLSMAQGFRGGVGALEGLSLVVGVAVVTALRALGVTGLGLKWPNDVLCDGAKLAGILLEVAGDVQGECQVVMGVGVNVCQPTDRMVAVNQSWTDLHTRVPGLRDRNRIASLMIRHLDSHLAVFRKSGFSAFAEAWRHLDVALDRPVRIFPGGGESVSGISRGVDENGALLVMTQQGLRRFHGGEVSLRLEDRDEAGA